MFSPFLAICPGEIALVMPILIPTGDSASRREKNVVMIVGLRQGMFDSDDWPLSQCRGGWVRTRISIRAELG